MLVCANRSTIQYNAVQYAHASVSLHCLDTSKPVDTELCRLPCDCQVGRWGRWSQCSATCHYGAQDSTDLSLTGYQTRTRDVIRPRSGGGVDCPALKEVRSCDWSNLPPCKRYSIERRNYYITLEYFVFKTLALKCC